MGHELQSSLLVNQKRTFQTVQKSNQNRKVEAKNRESNQTIIIAINREFD